MNLSLVFQAGDEEERKREKQARISKMESLMKELEELLKQDGKPVFSRDNPVFPVVFIVIQMVKYSQKLQCFFCAFAGLSFLTPVIGFYCQKCEEFIGDLNSAENHANIHHHSNSSSVSILPIYLMVWISLVILYIFYFNQSP